MKLEPIHKGALTLSAVIVAAAGVLGPIRGYVDEAIAQEAAAQVKEQMQPTADRLDTVVDLLRRDQDFKMTQACLSQRSQLRCRQESEHRWKLWAYQDCVQQRGEGHPQCVKPDPLPDPMIQKGQRKFVVAMTALLMGFVLAAIGILAGAEFVTLVGLVVGLFGGANVAEHIKGGQ